MCRRALGLDSALRERIAKQEFDLCVDAAQLTLGEPLHLVPDDGIEPEQKGFLLGHDY